MQVKVLPTIHCRSFTTSEFTYQYKAHIKEARLCILNHFPEDTDLSQTSWTTWTD